MRGHVGRKPRPRPAHDVNERGVPLPALGNALRRGREGDFRAGNQDAPSIRSPANAPPNQVADRDCVTLLEGRNGSNKEPRAIVGRFFSLFLLGIVLDRFFGCFLLFFLALLFLFLGGFQEEVTIDIGSNRRPPERIHCRFSEVDIVLCGILGVVVVVVVVVLVAAAESPDFSKQRIVRKDCRFRWSLFLSFSRGSATLRLCFVVVLDCRGGPRCGPGRSARLVSDQVIDGRRIRDGTLHPRLVPCSRGSFRPRGLLPAVPPVPVPVSFSVSALVPLDAPGNPEQLPQEFKQGRGRQPQHLEVREGVVGALVPGVDQPRRDTQLPAEVRDARRHGPLLLQGIGKAVDAPNDRRGVRESQFRHSGYGHGHGYRHWHWHQCRCRSQCRSKCRSQS
mmetsp:Transcript_7849/g.23092  ORF Transcript_7849/g.23092 Transcript_7849/m.23092 type:complete len:393 (-) Transcript_7849:544-1722(-)